MTVRRHLPALSLVCALALPCLQPCALPAQQAAPAPAPAAPPAPQASPSQQPITVPFGPPQPIDSPPVGTQPGATAPVAPTVSGAIPLPEDPGVPPITTSAPGTPAPAPALQSAETQPASSRIAPRGLNFNLFGLIGPYQRPSVPPLFPGNGPRLAALVHDDKLYLSLHDAIALALENNLDVEVSRYNLALADTDLRRAQGGGSLRGIEYTTAQTPNGVGAPGSPLLNSTANSPNPTTPAVTDLTSLNSTTATTTNFSVNPTGVTPEAGTNVPLFDPQFILTGGYLRRSNTVTLVSTTDATGSSTGTSGTGASGTGTLTTPQPLHYIAVNAAYLQGFSPGLQLSAVVNNDSQVIYSTVSENNPFYSPTTSVTLTQPLLRGRGRAVNLRYLRIANLDRRVSRLLFEQQVLDTIYGVSRLYFDLESLGENVTVKREALRAADRLLQDDTNQVEQGTLAPIELTRVSALASSSRFDLIQAQGLYRQQEVILRNQLIRTGSALFRGFSEIIPTDRITVPDTPDPASQDTEALVTQALARRPDLLQAGLQVQANRVSANAARNQVLPQLNVYANAQTRGTTEQAYEPLGTPGTGVLTVPQNLALGGLRTSTIYQAGIQLTLPVRNRIASADAARDTLQLRESEARTTRLQQQVRQDVETAVIALQTAFAAYQTAVHSRDYQAQLLDAERDKLSAGQSTPLAIVQDESFLAQARSTEIAARANYEKARISLDRSLGTLLDRNNIQLDDAIQGAIPAPAQP